MPINFDQLRADLYSIQQAANKMLTLVDAYLLAKVTVEKVDISFTAAQKAALVDRYSALKAELAATVGGLP